MEQQLFDKLYAPFDVQTKPGQGFKYIKSTDVIDRMNKVFRGNWSTEVVKDNIMEDIVVVHVEVTVYPLEGERVSYRHTGYGSSAIKRYSSGPNQGKIIDLGSVYKAAEAMAIRNACSRWGVGLYLDEIEESSDSTTTETPRSSSSMPNISNIPKSEPVKEVPRPVLPVSAKPFPPPVTSKPVEVEEPVVEKKEARPPSVPPFPSIPAPKPTEKKIESKAPMSKSFGTPNSGGFPKIPMPASVSQSATSSSDDDMISDVQKAALNGLLTIRGLEYNKLIKDAFEDKGIELGSSVPDPDALTYKEAVVVIRYGNDLFKKKN